MSLQKYINKTIVIKYGGNAMTNKELKNSVMKDIVSLSSAGIQIVLVHGGGPEINHMLSRVGIESKFIDGLRYTDKETIEVVEMVLAGKVNKSLVALIHSNHGRAMGLCGIDGGMLQVEKYNGKTDLGYVGEIKKVDISPIQAALEKGFIPVIATVGIDANGDIYNINADTAAAAIASALEAEKLLFMTDTKGLLRNKDDESTLIPTVDIKDCLELIEEGIISGGMIPKIQSCIDCIKNGVKEVAIIDGRIKNSLHSELVSEKSMGTVLINQLKCQKLMNDMKE